MDPKQLLLQHFEKGLLGVAAIWLLAVGAGFGSNPKDFDIKDKLQENIAKIKDYTSTHKVTEPPLPNWESDLKKNLLAANVPSAKEFPSWTLHNRPNLVYIFADVPTGQEPVHEPPIDVSARPERGKITVSWNESEDNALVVIDEYEVLRRVGPKGKWESVGKVSGDTNEREDNNVNPRSQYFYKVISHASIDSEHPLVSKAQSRGLMKKLKKGVEKNESSVTGPHKTPRVLIVIPNVVMIPTEKDLFEDVDAPAKCDLTVYKWDPEDAKGWARKRYYAVNERAKIGSKIKKGRREIDFTTGVLKSAVIIERPHPSIKGATKKYCIIVVKYADGSEEKFNNFDVQKELEGIWKPR
jgi:hypothetical protein